MDVDGRKTVGLLRLAQAQGALVDNGLGMRFSVYRQRQVAEGDDQRQYEAESTGRGCHKHMVLHPSGKSAGRGLLYSLFNQAASWKMIPSARRSPVRMRLTP